MSPNVDELVDGLLADFPPATTAPQVFLGEQFDRGLAWVHFPPGAGGLGLTPRDQQRAQVRLHEGGAPVAGTRNPIGYGMCAPTIATHGTPEQQAVCETLWNGAFRSVEEMRHYYAVMGPMYAQQHDPVEGTGSRRRAIYSPDALNRAFGPDGFLRHFDLRPELGRIIAPTLIMAGRHDWICPVEFSEEIHRLIPGSDLRVFEHSSHSIRADEPEAMTDAILGFVVYRT